jgi:uncharacterized repeat protein (TIGR01451 family)
VALATCTLSACRSGNYQGNLPPAPMVMQPGPGVDGPGPGVMAYADGMDGRGQGYPGCGPNGGPNAFEMAPYGTVNPDGTWRPPGIGGPWPHNEYLRDGGDYITPASVKADWSVAGVEQEDTVAHYDTLDGRTEVSPSNRVHIYAPRFGAVRRVDDVQANQAGERVAGFEKPIKLNRHDDLGVATTAIQPVQPHGEIGSKAASIYRERQQGGGLEHRTQVAIHQDKFQPFEDFVLIRRGVMDQADKPRLANAVDAAIVWSHDASVQIILDGQAAVEAVVDKSVEVVYTVDRPQGPSLRLVKVASTDTAKPGETVDFTLRYDNIGVEPIGNVVIIDNLSTRLEYVDASQSSDREAKFEAQPNSGGSQAVRWELTAPLEPGQGGIIRFQVRVK